MGVSFLSGVAFVVALFGATLVRAESTTSFVKRCSYIANDFSVKAENQPCLYVMNHDTGSALVTFRTGAQIEISDFGNNGTALLNGVRVDEIETSYDLGYYGYTTPEGEIFTIVPLETAGSSSGNFDETVAKYPELWDSLEPSELRTETATTTKQGDVYDADVSLSVVVMQKVETSFGSQNDIIFSIFDRYGGIESVVDLDRDGIDEVIVRVHPTCNICEAFPEWYILARDEQGRFYEAGLLYFEPKVEYDAEGVPFFEGLDSEGVNSIQVYTERYVYRNDVVDSSEFSSHALELVSRIPIEILETTSEINIPELRKLEDQGAEFSVYSDVHEARYSDASGEYVLNCEAGHYSIFDSTHSCTLNGVALDQDENGREWGCNRVGFVAPKNDGEELRLVCDANKTATVSELLNGAG